MYTISVKEDLLIDIDLPPCTMKTTPTKKPDSQHISLLDEPIDVPEIGKQYNYYLNPYLCQYT